jgi:hypothetical protein
MSVPGSPTCIWYTRGGFPIFAETKCAVAEIRIRGVSVVVIHHIGIKLLLLLGLGHSEVIVHLTYPLRYRTVV